MQESRNQQPVDGLQFNVAQLLKEATGASRSYDVAAEVQDGVLDEDIKIVSPITGRVKLLRTGRDILVTGLLQTEVEKICGRCLAVFTAPVSIELEEEFHPSLDIVTGAVIPEDPDADEANRIDEHHILDLWEVTRQELLLESDSVLYCRPDCKGLCPHCGQDRNLADCTCEEETFDQRWSGLKALQPED